MKRKRVTKDAIEILHHRYYEGKPERLAELEEARANAYIARTIHKLRVKSKLSQSDLAELVRTSTSVISRLEDADYEGHSLTMLRRIAAALNRRLEVRFLPLKSKSS
jgi:ribosome-binding protein aMBF1 (putative translation factor)